MYCSRESTANMWIKTYKALEQFGIQTKLANPFKTRVIAEARIKTDKLDAHVYYAIYYDPA